MSDTAEDVTELLRSLADSIESDDVALSKVSYQMAMPNETNRLDIEWWGELENDE